MSHIFKSRDFKKTKSRYSKNKTLFLLQIKKFVNCASRAKNSFVVEVDHIRSFFIINA